MSPNANDFVRDPRSSSRDSLKFGLESPLRGESLFTAHDFIHGGEEEEYADTLTSLMSELAPDGTVEETFAIEIMGATWRLRRCRLVEEAFGSIENLDCDPMVDERTEKQQKSVDRARAQSHLILRRSLAELRKLRTGRESPLRGESRTIQEQLKDKQPEPAPTGRRDAAPPPAPAGFAGLDALMAMADAQLARQYRESGLSSFCNPAAPPTQPAPPAAGSFCNPASKTTPPAGSFCEKPKMTARNAPCPCGSGEKYKRCCGKDAAPVLNRAA